MFLKNMKFFIIVLTILVIVSTSTVYGCDADEISANDLTTSDNANLKVNSLDYVSINDADPNDLNDASTNDAIPNEKFLDNTTINYGENQKNTLDNAPVSNTNPENDAASFDDLNNEIQNLKPGDTLDLDKDYYNTEDGHFIDLPITIDIDNITINGHSHTLDARNLSSFFYVTGRNVQIIGLNFVNGNYHSNRYAYELSPIVWAGDYGSIIDCNFCGNQAKRGGAITWAGNYGLINNTIFKNNLADYVGGAIYILGHDNTICNCNFESSYSYVANDVIYFDCLNGIINLEYLNFGNEIFTKNALQFPEISQYYINGSQYNISANQLSKSVMTWVTDEEIDLIQIIYASILNRYIYYNEHIIFYREYNATDFVLTFLRDFGGGVYYTKSYYFSNLTSLDDVFNKAELGDYKTNVTMMKSIVIHNKSEYENVISTTSSVFSYALTFMKNDTALNKIYKVLKIDFGGQYTFDSKKTWSIKKSNFDQVILDGNGSKISVSSGDRDENWWAELSSDTSMFLVSNIMIEGFNMGIRNLGGYCICKNVRFNKNRMDYLIDNDFGAGICNAGTCICYDCQFSNNYCSYGAGIFNQGILELHNCSFWGNYAYRHANDVCNTDGGKVSVDDNVINGTDGYVRYESSMSATARSQFFSVISICAISLGFAFGSLVCTPWVGMLIGAGIGAALGTLGGAFIVSETHDMSFNSVGTFTGLVALCILNGAMGGAFGSFLTSEFPREFDPHDYFFDNEMVFYRRYPIFIGRNFLEMRAPIILIH